MEIQLQIRIWADQRITRTQLAGQNHRQATHRQATWDRIGRQLIGQIGLGPRLETGQTQAHSSAGHPPFTAQQKVNLDKNNLLDEIHNLHQKFERSPIDTERRKIKNLFYDKYEELAKALEELRLISEDHRSQLRKDRDSANAFKNVLWLFSMVMSRFML